MRTATSPLAACLLLMQAVFFSGCAASDDAGALVLTDLQGNQVATAELTLPDPLPNQGESFEGRWTLTSSKDAFPADATRSGRYTGYVSAGGVSCDLNPGTADHNVVLFGTIDGKHYAGHWSLATIAGDVQHGTFAMPLP